jgi:hypothetical protein
MMCDYHYDPPPLPPVFPEYIPRWLRSMAEWEARQPKNVQARHSRKKWGKIHNFAADRYFASTNIVAGRFWYAVMMRAYAYEAQWKEDAYWRIRARETT